MGIPRETHNCYVINHVGPPMSDEVNTSSTMDVQKIFLLFVMSLVSSETEAGFVRTLTRLVQTINSMLRPRDNDVVSNPL